jgi:peptidoglycan/LPS O-acetylase OafA/YrhL
MPHARYPSLDGLRASMMILGIYLHSAIAYSKHGSWPWKDGTTTGVFDVSLGFIHVFRMPVFYVMAGFFAALLLEQRGRTAFVRNRAARILVPFAAGWLLLFPLVAALQTAGLHLDAPDSGLSAALAFLGSLDVLRRRPDFMHLWFLEYLLLFYAVAVAATPLSRVFAGAGQRLDRLFRATATSPFAPFALSVAVCPILLFMEDGAIDDAYGVLPEARIFAAYGIFFGWGWLLWRNAELLPALRHGRRVALFLALGVVASLFGYGLWYWRQSEPDGAALAWLASAWCLALAMWSFILGLIGLAQRLVDRPVPWIRYVADSSYWLYLVHMPVVLVFQILLADSEWTPALKAVAVFVASVAALLASYHVLVRPTWVGAILNGRRYPTSRRPRPGIRADTGARGAVRHIP